MANTPAQRNILRELKSHPNSVIWNYINPNGTRMGRMVDSVGSPRMNVRSGVISRMYSKGLLIKENNFYKINPEQLKKRVKAKALNT